MKNKIGKTVEFTANAGKGVLEAPQKVITAVSETLTKNIQEKNGGDHVQKLELLFVIVDRNKAEFYVDFLQNFEINMQTIMAARGTTKTEVLEYFGLADREKAVIMNVVRADMIPRAMDALEEKFHTIRNGKGVAFTIPFTGTIGVAIYQFLSNNRMTIKEESK